MEARLKLQAQLDTLLSRTSAKMSGYARLVGYHAKSFQLNYQPGRQDNMNTNSICSHGVQSKFPIKALFSY